MREAVTVGEVTYESFPRGFAETGGSVPTLNMEIEYGEMFDVGIKYYGEFIVCLEYGWELMNGGMKKVDGKPGELAVAQRYTNAVQLRWRCDP